MYRHTYYVYLFESIEVVYMTMTIEFKLVEIVSRCRVTGWLYRDEVSRSNAAKILMELLKADCVIIRKDS